jgi:hypothetical protein
LDVMPLAGARIFGHAIDDEAVKPVTGPLIPAAKSFKNYQWLAQFAAVLQSAIQREVVSKAAIRNHPIQHVAAGASHRGGIAIPDANGRNPL